MDVEWAFIEGADANRFDLKLLQARPITTLLMLDDKMMTRPGEKRVLYYDGNVIGGATTTTPFTKMDLDFLCKVATILYGNGSLQDAEDKNLRFVSESPDMPMFNSSTRQYMNMSHVLKYMSTEKLAKMTTMADPYSSIFDSKDCDRDRYRTKKLPKGINIRSTYKLLREIPFWSIYKRGQKFIKNPRQAKKEYIKMVERDMNNLDALVRKRESGLHKGTLKEYCTDLCDVVLESINEAVAAIESAILGNFNKLDEKRRDEKLSKEVREEYEALCGGYAGDELMEINIAMYKLAQKLPVDVLNQYDHDSMKDLAIRIQNNLDMMKRNDNNQKVNSINIPVEFLESWTSFMKKFGYDGQDQLFMSCPRYNDSPHLLLAKMRLNAL